MKTRPVVAWRPAGVAPADAESQAESGRLLLRASRLPQRWAGRRHFVVLDTAFGVGDKFLATWHAWQEDPQRCERLFFVAVAQHPPTRDDLAGAHASSPWPGLADALRQAWPPLTPNLHPLSFDGDRVRLLLAFGDLATLLRELQARVDAFFLDAEPTALGKSQSPANWDRRIFKALARLAEPGATVVMGGLADPVSDGLSAAGFEVEHAPGYGAGPPCTLARYAPRFVPRVALPRVAPEAAPTPVARHAVVIGAGLAGASAASALASLGWTVQLVDRHAAPAAETSGNPAGLFHGTLHPGDGPHARLFRAAALAAERAFRPLIEQGRVPGRAVGLLRRHGGSTAAMQALIDAQALPPDYVQALDAAAASAQAGVGLEGPAWCYPGGGWLSPADLVRHWLRTPGVQFSGGLQVAAVQRLGGVWHLIDAHGEELAQAPVLVLANAADAARLLAPLGHAAWPLQRSRGQVSGWAGGPSPAMEAARPALLRPLAGEGYALPLVDGGLLCGATVDLDDEDDAVREIDHHYNFDRLQRLAGLRPPADPALWSGRVGWRLQADDRLPVVGPVPLPGRDIDEAARLDQVRRVPRTPGLWVLTGLGARGITLAPLMGDLLAAQIDGTPWPLERDLADAVDPARWLVRRARREPS